MSSFVVGIDHVQLAMPVGGEEAARPFFIDLLGFREIPKPEALQARGGLWLQAGSVQLHLGAQDDFVSAKKAHPAFLVADLNKLRQRLLAHQIEIKIDPNTPNAPRFFISDPFSNRIEFIQDGFGFNQE